MRRRLLKIEKKIDEKNEKWKRYFYGSEKKRDYIRDQTHREPSTRQESLIAIAAPRWLNDILSSAEKKRRRGIFVRRG